MDRMTTAATATRHPPRSMLRLALQTDAAVVAVAGLALTVGASPVGDLLDLDPTLLRVVGVALLPWAGWVARVSQRPTGAMVRSVIVGNALWVVTSLLVLGGQVIDPNRLGSAFIVLQAALVAVIAWWQVRSQRAEQTA